ncbi:MAG: hypothetical protein ACOY82_15215 [Pseudomonadota bacterium]
MPKTPFLAAVFCTALFAAVPAHADEDAPWSEIEVGGVADSDLGQHDVIMMAIDGSMDFRDRSIYELAPGRHHFRIASTRRGRSGEMTARPFVIEAQPCVRYALIADHGTGEAAQSWRIAVAEETPIKSCMKKFATRLASDTESASAGP